MAIEPVVLILYSDDMTLTTLASEARRSFAGWCHRAMARSGSDETASILPVMVSHPTTTTPITVPYDGQASRRVVQLQKQMAVMSWRVVVLSSFERVNTQSSRSAVGLYRARRIWTPCRETTIATNSLTPGDQQDAVRPECDEAPGATWSVRVREDYSYDL